MVTIPRMDSFTLDAVVIAAVLPLTVASMGGWFAALIGGGTPWFGR